MNKKVLFALSILLLTSSLVFAENTDYAPGRILVRFDTSMHGLSSSDNQQRIAARQAILNKAGGGSVKSVYKNLDGWCVVQLPQGMCVREAVRADGPYLSRSEIIFAEPDYKIKLHAVPNDQRFSELWALQNAGQTAGSVIGADIKATEAWDYWTDGSEVIVAVVDSGVDYAHSDLAANMWINWQEYYGQSGKDDDGNGYIDDIYGYDFAGTNIDNPVPDSNPMDFLGHGTHVAGTIGAVGNNNLGVIGVCWKNIKIMALKIGFDDDPVGYIYVSGAAEAIDYATTKGANVINASWGGTGSAPQILEEAIGKARNAGIIFVASAGNDSEDNDSTPRWPTGLEIDNIISVMASDNKDFPAYYSNYGAVTVDIAAPGGTLYFQSDPRGILSTVPGNNYQFYQGTSMAAPHVTGACALLLSLDPSLNYTQIKQILINTADQKDSLSSLCAANGRLNLLAAAEEVVFDTTPPAPNPSQWAVGGQPKAVGRFTIAMEAKQSTDSKGTVEYLFECTTNAAFNSNWQSSNVYLAQGLTPDTTYVFRVRARDDSGNMTSWSGLALATTALTADNLSPFPDPAQWDIEPRLLNPAQMTVLMSAKAALDENGPIKYAFYVYDSADSNTPMPTVSRFFNAPDAANTTYMILSGLTPGETYYFEVYAQDALGNTTAANPRQAVNGNIPRTLEVPLQYSTLGEALVAAQNGDTIVIHRGVHVGKTTVVDKNVIIRGTNPDNPDVVADTILDFQGTIERQRGFELRGNSAGGATPYCELRGLTLRNIYFRENDGVASEDTQVLGGGILIYGNHFVENCIIRDVDIIGGNGIDGIDGSQASPFVPLYGGHGAKGGDVGGAGIAVFSGSPIVRGTIIQECFAYAGHGGDGGDGTDAAQPTPIDAQPEDSNNPGGRGGNGGNSGAIFGAGIYVDPMAINPAFENCVVRDCFAVGGMAGNGGEGGDNADKRVWTPRNVQGDGSGGHGGVPGAVLGAGIYCGSNATLKGCTIERNYALAGYAGNGGSAGVTHPTKGVFPGGVGGLIAPTDPELSLSIPQGLNGPDVFTARGGGLYAVNNVFIDGCTVRNNYVRGTISGLGGFGSLGGIRVRPRQNYQVETLGAGIVSADGSSVDIRDSYVSGNTILNNRIDRPFSIPGREDVFPEDNISTDLFPLYYPLTYYGWGGGFYVDDSQSVLITNTEISGNDAAVGGGFAIENEDNIYFYGSIVSQNTAKYGAGIAIVDSILDINDSVIRDNTATYGSGGGIHSISSSLVMINSRLMSNSCTASGGGIFALDVDANSFGQEITNCLIQGNSAYLSGGGIAGQDRSFFTIKNCTIVENLTTSGLGSGGGVSCITYDEDKTSFIEIISSILWDNSSANGSQIAVGDPIVSSEISTIWTHHSDVQGGSAAIFEGAGGDPRSYWGAGNIDTDPLFVRANAQDQQSAYYLSHLAANQLADSPCVNAGQDTADNFISEIQMQATTRTDGVVDTGVVDMGYHYPIFDDAKTYNLTIEVDVEPGFEPNGFIRAQLFGDYPWTREARRDPCSFSVPQGTIVRLTAIADPDFKVDIWTGADSVPAAGDPCNVVTMDSRKTVKVSFTPDGFYYLTTKVETENGYIQYIQDYEPVLHPGRTMHRPGEVVKLIAVPDDPSHITHWSGTDNDMSIARENTVTMNGRKDVVVRFTAPRILYVGADSDYPTIQLAIDDSQNGDIVMIAPGVWDIYESSEGSSGSANYLDHLRINNRNITVTGTNPDDANTTTILGGFVIAGVSRDCVIQGLTITGRYRYADPGTPTAAGSDGNNGRPQHGGGMQLHEETETGPGDGWNVIKTNSGSPTVRNCIFRNCFAGGRNGSDGANGTEGDSGNGGWGGWAHGGAVSCGPDSNPLFENCIFEDNLARGGDGGNGTDGGQDYNPGHGGNWGDETWSGWDYGPFKPYWKFSGYGGAVYIDSNSAAEFINCNFINNRVEGGSCGISGTINGMRISGWPYQHYKIDRFGGAVYAAADSEPFFKNCSFINNLADSSQPALHRDNGVAVPAYQNISHGGAIAFEDDALVTFENCVFQENNADLGGAVYYTYSSPLFYGCEISDNNALSGGGIFAVGGSGIIERCVFNGNLAVGEGAMGGAVVSLGANTEIIDAQIVSNYARASGGGVYLSNKDVNGNELTPWDKVLIHNCLIASNSAGSDGGGISANWHSYPEIENCTIAYNFVSGSGYGGGLYSSYGNYTTINNSILWGNLADNGNQIAIRPSARPASVVAGYSDIQGGVVAKQYPATGGDIWKDSGCTFINVGGNIGGNPADEPLFEQGPGGNYYLSQISAGQSQNSPCVDRGSKTAAAAILGNGIALNRYTTRTDEIFDKGTVDMGFHYPLVSEDALCKVCDLKYDGKIDFLDFAKMAAVWLNQNCSETNNWCNGADFNFDNKVNIGDSVLFAECWLAVDNNPPSPNPMMWEVTPFSSSAMEPYKITMKAQLAFDAWGWPVQYQFECITDPNFDSGWINSNQYIASGLQGNTGYVFRVRAREVREGALLTDWSEQAGTVTGTEEQADDDIAPTPNPMTFSQEPYAVSDTEIGMIASLAADVSGVEYGFWNTTTSQIIWQNEREFIASGLTPSTTYTFRVAARDKSFKKNTTAWSEPASATTAAAGQTADREPPITGVYDDIYKAAFALEPVETSGDGFWHTMTAVTAADATGPVQYKFYCRDDSRYNSGWQISPEYTVNVSSGSSKRFWYWRVETRDSVVPIPNYGTSSDWFNPEGNTQPY